MLPLLKDLPIEVQLVCARPKYGNANTLSQSSLLLQSSEHGANIYSNQGEDAKMLANSNNNNNQENYLDNNNSQLLTQPFIDRLVKAKSDGSLAITPLTSISTSQLTSELSRLRSRSLEPLSGLAMWSSEPQLIKLIKGDRGLGFSILDYQVSAFCFPLLVFFSSHSFPSLIACFPILSFLSPYSIHPFLFDFSLFQDPMNPSETVIVIRSLVPGGVAQQDGRLLPGDRLLFVNDRNLENASLEQAVQALKGAPRGKCVVGVAKPLPLPDSTLQLAASSQVSHLRDGSGQVAVTAHSHPMAGLSVDYTYTH